MPSTTFYPKSTSIKLQDIICFSTTWAKGKYDLVVRNCYHFVSDIIERFTNGDKAIIMKKVTTEWFSKGWGGASLALKAIFFF